MYKFVPSLLKAQHQIKKACFRGLGLRASRWRTPALFIHCNLFWSTLLGTSQLGLIVIKLDKLHLFCVVHWSVVEVGFAISKNLESSFRESAWTLLQTRHPPCSKYTLGRIGSPVLFRKWPTRSLSTHPNWIAGTGRQDVQGTATSILFLTPFFLRIAGTCK